MRLQFLGLALLASALTSSCSSFRKALDPIKIPLKDAEDPGFFDVGAGFGRVNNVAGGSSGDASGILVSFKAYPWGRWYGEAKQDNVIRGLSDFDKQDIKTLLDGREADGIAFLGGDGKDTVERLKAVVADRSVVMQAQAHAALGRLLDPTVETLTPAENDILTKVAMSPPPSRKWRVIEERDSWYNRFSVFYGISAGDFTGGGLEGGVNALGIGYDVSPDFALHVGYGFYDFEANGAKDSDESLYYGVSLNLFAFKDFLKAVAGVTEN